jgi:hypothetical protein
MAYVQEQGSIALGHSPESVAGRVADQIRLRFDYPRRSRSSSELSHQNLAQQKARERLRVARNAFALERDGKARSRGVGYELRAAIGGNVGSPSAAARGMSAR